MSGAAKIVKEVQAQLIGSDPAKKEKVYLTEKGTLMIAVAGSSSVSDGEGSSPAMPDFEHVTMARDVSSFELVPNGKGFDLKYAETRKKGTLSAHVEIKADELREYLEKAVKPVNTFGFNWSID
ncbi:MAG: hypothetical protein Q7T03_08270 [Deltaproteobacteria bacterium]|nr:hypothetical protein [Deltaproteobacteria bacterium]